jgi:hypothetical protein
MVERMRVFPLSSDAIYLHLIFLRSTERPGSPLVASRITNVPTDVFLFLLSSSRPCADCHRDLFFSLNGSVVHD